MIMRFKERERERERYSDGKRRERDKREIYRIFQLFPHSCFDLCVSACLSPCLPVSLRCPPPARCILVDSTCPS